MAHVVILNGPPGCGKDTIADVFVKMGAQKLQFKDGLYKATAEVYGLHEDFVKLISTKRDMKEVPHPALGGLSPRQALIHVSEDIWKPQYGSRVFGEMLSDSAVHDFVIVPDGGFQDELNAVEAVHNVTVIRLHRKGFTFEGDSRTYAEDKWAHYEDTVFKDVHLEDGDIMKAVGDVIKAIQG